MTALTRCTTCRARRALGLPLAVRGLSGCAAAGRPGGSIVLANPAASSCSATRTTSWSACRSTRWCPTRIRPRHAAYREAYGRNPRPRPMGTQMELVAKRRDGSEVMVEIALSPLQDHGLPLGRGGDPRHRRLPARQAGAAARALQRVSWRSWAGWRSTRATRRCCWSRCRPSRPRRLQVESRGVCTCWSRTASSSAWPAASA